jgi:hypothetical protein
MVRVDLLSILIVADSWRRSSVSATFTGTDTARESLALLFCSRNRCSTKVLLNVPDYLAMDGARDAVLQLEVHLGNGVFWEYGGV